MRPREVTCAVAFKRWRDEVQRTAELRNLSHEDQLLLAFDEGWHQGRGEKSPKTWPTG